MPTSQLRTRDQIKMFAFDVVMRQVLDGWNTFLKG
jgi:hypothetical protein